MAISLLIVDDSAIARKMLIRCLPAGDFDIREAGDGTEGLKLFQESEPDLVLLDLTMPGLSGFEVLDKIMEINPVAKVVVVTADIQEKARQRVIQGGALGMLNKPPDTEKLSNFIKSAAS